MQSKFVHIKDKNQLHITREFAAPVQTVWDAWTNPVLLDQWWAPKPWKAVTQHQNFSEGGDWIYCMQGPDGEQSWAKATYSHIVPLQSFEGTDVFTNAEGIVNTDLPTMHWRVMFTPVTGGTLVEVTTTFTNASDLEKIIEMGFREGFSAAHDNLDALIAGTIILN